MGLLDYLEDSPWSQVFQVVANGFGDELPRRPFEYWKLGDDEFQDLVLKMTSVDPNRRITAKEALAHKWFHEVE